MKMTALEQYQVDVRRSSRRRTLCLRVVDGCVRLNAPHYVSSSDLNNFVAEKRDWLEKQLRAQRSLERHRAEKFEIGGQFHYLGRPLCVAERPGLKQPQPDRDTLFLPCTLKRADRSAARQKQLADWLKAQAQQVLSERVDFLGRQMGLQARKVSVRLYKRRWGSCSHDGHIQLNWLLMMAPPDIQDYVVVHELAHLRVFDHSPRFWALVEQHCPSYRADRQWLRTQTTLHW